MSWTINRGDCVETMRGMDECSVDAVVCDPPYGLEFMGKEWDRLDTWTSAIDSPRRLVKGTQPNFRRQGHMKEQQAWHQAWGTEALRVLKPGGHLLAFGGSRTVHRLACAIEDAGFEIRDTIAWMYGSGFPKSLDVSKAIDRQAGAEREVVGQRPIAYPDSPSGYTSVSARSSVRSGGIWSEPDGDVAAGRDVTAPATPEAQQWQGFGTALKPAHEPIVVARKPLSGTVAKNCLEFGTGALNVDGTRIGGEGPGSRTSAGGGEYQQRANSFNPIATDEHPSGRWPANVVLDEQAAELLDEQTGELGASRFFYCSKAGSEERSKGLNGQRSNHPTVKPISLMRWLVRLVTPPNGTVLDPFTGSGTTGIACALEGFAFIGIEKDPDYVHIAKARIRWWAKHAATGQAAAILAAGETRDQLEAAGQDSLF